MLTYPIQHGERTFTPAGEIATRDDRQCADCGTLLHRPENGSIFPHYAIVDDTTAVCVPCANKREIAQFRAADRFVGYFTGTGHDARIITFNGATLARVYWYHDGWHNMAGRAGIRYWQAVDDATGARWYGKFCPAWRQVTTMRRAK